MVKVFTRPTCAPCKTVKYWLDRHNISYEEVNIDETPADVFIVPTIVIGDNVVEGLNFALLNSLLLTSL